MSVCVFCAGNVPPIKCEHCGGTRDDKEHKELRAYREDGDKYIDKLLAQTRAMLSTAERKDAK